MFRWGVENELIPVEAYQALTALSPDRDDFPVTVDVQAGKIFVDGVEHEAAAHHCQIVQALLEAEGLYVTGPEMTNLPSCQGKNISREIKNLEAEIPAIKAHLLHEGPRGYRLVW